MRVLITGASGFIGCQLAQQALRGGHEVTAVTALNNDVERARCQRLTDAGVHVELASLEERPALERVLAGQEAVIHLAAAQHEAGAPEAYFRQVNVEGTRTLLELAVRSGVARFVYGSTIGVYGSQPGARLTEDSPLAPDNPYGRTKAEAERVAREFASRIGLCIVRISETYGPGDMRLLKLFRAVQSGRWLTIGDGRNLHQLIYVEDLAQGLLAAMHATAASGTTVLLAGSEELSTDAMVGAIGAAVGRPDPPRHVPLWPFEIAAGICERVMPPLGLRPLLHRRRLDFFRKSFQFSPAAAERVLGFRATTSFASGARLTADWYRAQGLLAAPPPGP
jgi:nucleoside-diphosphate-sugar epimerase